MAEDIPSRWLRVPRKVLAGVRAVRSRPRLRSRAFALLAALLVGLSAWRGITRVDEGFVGVYVNNLTGDVSMEDRAGTRFTIVAGTYTENSSEEMQSRYAEVRIGKRTGRYDDHSRPIDKVNSAMKECVTRINRILVVVDPSATGRQAAIDKAALLARCLNASVELLICDIASAFDDPPANSHPLDLLETLAVPLRAQGTEVKLRIIRCKSLPDVLADYIPASKADLVIKDTHHHSFAIRTFLRNTDWHLTQICTVPLLLTKTQPWSPSPIILAAVDPNHANPGVSAVDREILSNAAALTALLKGDLHVIHTFLPTAFAARDEAAK